MELNMHYNMLWPLMPCGQWKHINISGAVNAGGIIFQATFFLAMSFVPKVM